MFIEYLHMNYTSVLWIECVRLTKNSRVESLTPGVVIFGGRASAEVIKVKRGHKSGAFIPE